MAPTIPPASPQTPPPVSPEPIISQPDSRTVACAPAVAPIARAADDHFYSRVFAIATIALLGLALYQIVLPFLGPLIWALFLAFLLHPLHVRMTRQFKGRENVSAALLTLATLVILIGPVTAMSAAFVAQAGDLVQWVQETLAKRTQQQYRMLADVPFVEPMLQWMRDNFGISTAHIQNWIAQGAQQLPRLLADLGGKIFLGAINTALAFVVMLFMFFFFVRDGAEFVAMLRDLTPMTPARRQQLMDHVAAVTRAVVFGTGITVLVQGALVGIAFMLTGLSAPLVFGALAALAALLPFGGTAFVWLPALLVLAGQDNWSMAIAMLAIGLMSSTVDNVLRPLLISGRAEIGTLPVFVGVLGGAAAFGPIGLFLGPVVLALIIALMRFALELRRAS